MVTYPVIDKKTRFLVLYLDADWKATRISKTIGVPLRTVQSWIEKTEQGSDVRKIQEGRGRKTTKTPALRKKVLRQAKMAPTKASTRNLASRDGVTRTTIHDIYVDRGLKYQGVETLTNLTNDQMCKRVEYCLDMVHNEGEKIYETFFSDEMGIRLSEAHPKKTWGLPYKKLKTEKPLQDIKINCWGAISFEGATSLHIFRDNLDAPLYQNILLEHKQEMQALYPEGFYFQQDNLPAHKASREWIKKNGLGQFTFPDYSPDLNVIENLWSALKERVRSDNPLSETSLIRSLQMNWEILSTPENLRPYFESLHSRYLECIEKKGIRLKY